MTNKEELISVIMPVYNTPINELNEAIESILNQTYKNLEFIIYDDGSNEEVKKYLKSIENKDNRIKVFLNNDNVHLQKALNRCIQYSKGKYIARMDSDDISYPTRLEKQCNFLSEHQDIDLVGCNSVFFNKDEILGNRQHSEIITKKDFLKTCPVVHPTFLVKKEIFDKYGLYNESKVCERVEDYEILFRFFSNNVKIANLQETLFKIRTDDTTYKRRKYRYRINEAIIRFKGYKKLKMLHYAFPFVMKPLIVGLLPNFIMKIIHRSN